jgi:hypothetical protein
MVRARKLLYLKRFVEESSKIWTSLGNWRVGNDFHETRVASLLCQKAVGLLQAQAVLSVGVRQRLNLSHIACVIFVYMYM